jgi:hypothetical protein
MRCADHNAAPGRLRPAKLAIPTLLAVFIVATPAWAVPTIDFFVTPGTGVVAYGGDGGPMVGTGIGISAVRGTDTPAPPIPFACIDCTMNFITGPLVAADSSAWVFGTTGPGAGIVISGSVDITGDGVGDLGPPFDLLRGVFVAPTVTVDLLAGLPSAALGITEAVFLDIKSPSLAGFYGLPPFPFLGELTLTWGGVGDPPEGFLGSTLEGGLVRNRFVPEPATVALLGVGLVGLLGARRRARPAS